MRIDYIRQLELGEIRVRNIRLAELFRGSSKLFAVARPGFRGLLHFLPVSASNFYESTSRSTRLRVQPRRQRRFHVKERKSWQKDYSRANLSRFDYARDKPKDCESFSAWNEVRASERRAFRFERVLRFFVMDLFDSFSLCLIIRRLLY